MGWHFIDATHIANKPSSMVAMIQVFPPLLSLLSPRELDHIPTVIHSLWFAADLHQVRREPQKVEEFTEVLLPLLSQHGSAVSLANAAPGWAKVIGGQCQEGIRQVKDGLTAWRATGSKFQVTFRLVRAAEACLFAGAKDDGLKLTDEALDQSGDIWFLGRSVSN